MDIFTACLGFGFSIDHALQIPDVQQYVFYVFSHAGQSKQYLNQLVPALQQKLITADTKAHNDMLLTQFHSVLSRMPFVLKSQSTAMVDILQAFQTMLLTGHTVVVPTTNEIPMQPMSSGAQVALFFPSEASFKLLVKQLDDARTSMDICVFNLTDNDLSNAILRASKRGVKVRIISDDDQAQSQGSDVLQLRERDGIPVKLDKTPAHMHQKFVVIDGTKLLNGSYNWTKGARFNNNENIVVSHDAQLAKSFQDYFNKLWQSL